MALMGHLCSHRVPTALGFMLNPGNQSSVESQIGIMPQDVFARKTELPDDGRPS